ncbi:unnamed protein product, partial [Amoebophrya sp. A120]
VGNSLTKFHFSDCRMFWKTPYTLWVYLEDMRGNRDGSKTEAINVTTPASNDFIDSPALTARAVSDTVSIRFSAEKKGVYWCQVTEEKDSPLMDDFRLKRVTDVLVGNPNTCAKFAQQVPAQTMVSCVLTGCNFNAEKLYTGFIYLEDEFGGGDSTTGTFQSVPITLSVSNSFAKNPTLTAGVEPTRDGLQVDLLPSGASGNLWGMFVRAAVAEFVTRDSLLQFVNAQGTTTCRAEQLPLTSNTVVTRLAFSGCSFSFAESYMIFAYIEDSGGNNDGRISTPIPFSVSFSNSFVSVPALTRTPFENFVELKFTPLNSGVAFASIVEEYLIPQLSPENIQTAGNCRLPTTAVLFNRVETLRFEGCNLLPAMVYGAFVYIEGSRTFNDGQVSAVDFELPLANDLLLSPPEITNLDADGFTLVF